MNLVDPRELSDHDLFMYLLFGDLGRPGWSGRRRLMAFRMLELAALTVAAAIVVIGLGAMVAFVIAGLG